MATLTPILCAPCGYEKHNKIAKKWCTVCKEGLCEKYENMHLTSEMSEEHMLITNEDYQKQVKINQICEEHQRKYEYYCTSHDQVICAECSQHIHGSCAEKQSLEEAAQHLKTSEKVSS